MPYRPPRLLLQLAIAVLVGLMTVFAYWPGFEGPFLFDDYANLDKLGHLGGVNDWETFCAFLSSGNSGPTGRPISLLSFLLNAQDWPANPFWFKLTNLVIHLINAALLFFICGKLLLFSCKHTERKQQFFWVALFVAGFWAVHPYLVSTTLYVVQRMAQLSAMFSFAGMLLYLHVRSAASKGSRRAVGLILLGIPLITALAVLSKENGALLPLFILLLEVTVFHTTKTSWAGVAPSFKWTIVLVAVLPSIGVVLYLLSQLMLYDIWVVDSNRGFSVVERLMSEARALFIYLQNWLMPSTNSATVFNDDFVKSTGLFSPITTLLSIIGHVLIISAGIYVKRRNPLAAFAVLFFYVGHLVESTTIKLELYFDHRNYLPLAFLVLPLAHYVGRKLKPSLAVSLGAATLMLLGGITRLEATTWRSYDSMVVSWAASSPSSSRAQQQLSMLLSNHGHHAQAVGVVRDYILRQPKDLSMRIWMLILQCRQGVVSEVDLVAVTDLASKTAYDIRSLSIYEEFVNLGEEDFCRGLDVESIDRLLTRQLDFPYNANRKNAQYAQLNYLKGRLALISDRPEWAARYFRESLSSRPSPDAAMQFAAQLASQGYYLTALTFADQAERYVAAGKLGASGRGSELWVTEIAHFKKIVSQDLSENRHRNVIE